MPAISRFFVRSLAVALCLGALFSGVRPAPAVAREKAEAGHHHAALPAATRLSTDAVLRKGMDDIAASLGRRIDAVEKGGLTGPEYLQLAHQTEARLSAIVKNCTLAPKADGAFHAILADMNQAVELMRSKKIELQRAGALALGQALRNYGRYFEHPGWTWLPAEQ